ncbi:MAG: EAL and HDOD domain-containing protein [Proteocatella sp.]
MFKYMARQPIFDINNKIFGYELLFRNSEENFYPSNISASESTRQLISNLLIDFGVGEISNDKPIFINFTRDALMTDVILLIEPRNIVVEILEDTHIDDYFIKRVEYLKGKGYIFALDDYTGDSRFDDILALVDYVKVDLLIASLETQKIISKKLRNKILLAEKVENEESIVNLKKMGYSLFQGFYFSKPQIVRTKALDASMATYMKLLDILKKESCDFHELSFVIKQDVAMVNKLLKRVNTSYYSPFGHKIESIPQALALLGIREIKRWISLIMLQSVADTKGEQVIYTALFRAIFSENITKILYVDKELSDCAYYSGLFSVFEKDKDLLEEFSDHFNLGRKNEISNLLDLSISYENANWNEITNHHNNLDLSSEDVFKTYKNSLNYVDKIIRR